ncbi:hypothetical protein ACFFON_02110 [Arthrobacter citreus]|uniref:hypothetical protein n=1 Tax=Arthrobacter TaxID=1663 RepID=UPI001264E187|nr:hypothetical protein [Arthrobacter gandavensis]
MAERGNTTHGSRLDDEMKTETQGLTKNTLPDHAEEWRQPEPMPDDTDSGEVLDAMEPNRTSDAGESGRNSGKDA